MEVLDVIRLTQCKIVASVDASLMKSNSNRRGGVGSVVNGCVNPFTDNALQFLKVHGTGMTGCHGADGRKVKSNLS